MRTALSSLLLLLCCVLPTAAAQSPAADSSFVCGLPETKPYVVGGQDSIRAAIIWPTRDDITCTVFVELTVEVDGTTSDPEIRRGCRADVDEAAIEALSRVRFEPATLYLKPVPMRYIQPVWFR